MDPDSVQIAGVCDYNLGHNVTRMHTLAVVVRSYYRHSAMRLYLEQINICMGSDSTKVTGNSTISRSP